MSFVRSLTVSSRLDPVQDVHRVEIKVELTAQTLSAGMAVSRRMQESGPPDLIAHYVPQALAAEVTRGIERELAEKLRRLVTVPTRQGESLTLRS